MSPKKQEPRVRRDVKNKLTDKSLEIPVPTSKEFDTLLKNAATKKALEEPGRQDPGKKALEEPGRQDPGKPRSSRDQ